MENMGRVYQSVPHFMQPLLRTRAARLSTHKVYGPANDTDQSDMSLIKKELNV